MKYVYPNNLMARRSEKREIIKGAVFIGIFVCIIVGLFIASDYSDRYKWKSSIILCANDDPSSCKVQ